MFLPVNVAEFAKSSILDKYCGQIREIKQK